MSQSFFRFKQFTVHQDRCAMKVCTDACAFGAWMISIIRKQNIKAERILDIGTGTGLLSLMIAQGRNALVDAVEIDAQAALQASENFAASPWAERLHVINGNAMDLVPSYRYDLVISNPPFFEDDLKSPDPAKNLAMHGDSLRLAGVIQLAAQQLTANGFLGVLLPSHRAEYFEGLAATAGLYVSCKTELHQTPSHEAFRTLLLFARTASHQVTEQLIIKDNNGNYEEHFKKLLRDYYLNF